jgi:hypothetical protein
MAKLASDHQLHVALEKLQLLEDRCAALRSNAMPGDRSSEIALRSLKRLANQFKEEIARYQAGVDAAPN